MNFNGMDSVKEYFSAPDISTVYSMYILETVILVKFQFAKIRLKSHVMYNK